MPPTLSPMFTGLRVGTMSLDEYLALDLPDVLTELVDGQVVVMSSPAGPHQRLLTRLGIELAVACPAGYELLVGPVDWVLRGEPRATVRVPDLVVVRHEQADEPRLVEPPLLAVEVVSPTSFERDVVTKRHEYARAGLRHYWIARPDTGEIVRYGRAGDELVEIGRLVAGAPVRIAEPFPVTIDVGRLVGPRGG